jgi:tetratricopeptide (TPR) repeat protein
MQFRIKNPCLNAIGLSFVFSVLLLTTDVLGQTDSLSLIQSMDAAEKIIGKDFPTALNLYQDINKRASVSPCATCRQRSVILLGKAFWINGEYDTAVFLLKQGVGYAQRSGDLNQLASVANMIALNFYYQAYYDSAISYFQQSYTFYDTLHDRAGMARVLSNISLMYHRKGDYPKTVEYLLRGEELNDKLVDEPRSIGDFPGMENVFPDSVYFREEIADNLRSLTVHLKNGDLQAANTNYLNLAVAYNQVKEYLTAARYYIKVY